jgi:hypothetical protein
LTRARDVIEESLDATDATLDHHVLRNIPQ